MSIAESYRTNTIVSIAFQPLPRLIKESQISFHRSDDVEKREIFDFPTGTPTLSEVIQVIHDSWELGLNDDLRFLDLMGRIKGLVDERIVGGEVGERHPIGEQCRFDSHWQGGAEMKPRVQVNPGGEMEQDNSSTTWSEGSDARSMTHSAYTVRSVTSWKEQTSQRLWPRNEK